MANKTWVGGHAGNNAANGANWTPAGAPRHGDSLNVATGTLAISGNALAGDTLHINNRVVPWPTTPVTLDLNNTTVGIDGSLNFGDPFTINATGQDNLNAAGGFLSITGSINLAANSHLFMTGGSMQFAYAGAITGGAGSSLTNNGHIEMTNGKVSVPVNGSGTLAFDAYHSGHGGSLISAPVSHSQTVELKPLLYGLNLTLADPGDFHALLQADPPRQNESSHDYSTVVVGGVHADSFSVSGNHVMLTNGGRPVDLLRVANAGSMQFALSDSSAGAVLDIHTPGFATS